MRGISAALAALLGLALSAPVRAQDRGPPPATAADGTFEQAAPGALPAGWNVNTVVDNAKGPPLYRAAMDTADPRSGKTSVRVEQAGALPERAFGIFATGVDATKYRGKRVRFTGAVRVRPGGTGQVGLWLRVGLEDGRGGFMDNMHDRPIVSPVWAEYVIEGDVAQDAAHISFGLMTIGGATAWFDDARLEIVGPARSAGAAPQAPGQPVRPRTAPGAGDVAPRALTARGTANLEAFARLYGYLRWFHPSDEAAASDWDRLALLGVERAEKAGNARELAEALGATVGPVAPTVSVWVTGGKAPADAEPAAGPGVRWVHRGLAGKVPGSQYASAREKVERIAPEDMFTAALPGGVSVRVPLALAVDAAGKSMPAAATALIPEPAKPAGYVPSGFDRTTRLAAAVQGWALFQHFYPYWDVVKADWPAELRRTLAAAATDTDDLAFHRTLRRLVAALQDGHGRVIYPTTATGMLPVAWDVVEGRLAITAAPSDTGAARGDVVSHIGGRRALEALAEYEALHSGTPQWRRVGALEELLGGKAGESVELTLQGPGGAARTVRMTYAPANGGRIYEARRDTVSEIEPGIYYVDIDRLTADQWPARLADVAKAKAVIFDMRGYPKGYPHFLQHMRGETIHSAKFEIPQYRRPDGEGVTFDGGAWTMLPLEPRLTSNLAFITRGSAISFAESVMGVVAGNKLADIVGETTAGANGNINIVDTVGGYGLVWTGMRTLNQDGSRHHLAGVKPTVPVSRTLKGVAEGRDELLERAVAVVKARMAP